MCINEQSLLEIEALVGKTLVQWDYKILMKFLWELPDKIKKKNFWFSIVPTLNKSIQNRLYLLLWNIKSFHDKVMEFFSGDVEKRVLAEQIKKDILSKYG